MVKISEKRSRSRSSSRLDFTGTISTSTNIHKSVVFPRQEHDLATVAIIIESIEDISEEDKKNLWFARSDYHFSRSSARVIAKESERYGHSKHLDDVYISDFDQVVQDKLKLWSLHGSSRRGLERWANSSHGILRKDDQRGYIKGVICAQTEMRLRGADKLATEQRIRDVGDMLSQKSRLFARMIASADAQAAKWEFRITDVSKPAISSRKISRQVSNRQLGLIEGRVLTRKPKNPSVSNLRANTNSRSQAPVTRTKSSTRISIRAGPARVSRMA
jgi:hypothetical protein